MSNNDLDDKILNSINEFIGSRLELNKIEQDDMTQEYNNKISSETNNKVRMILYDQLQTEINKYRTKELKLRSLISLIHTIGNDINSLEGEIDRYNGIKVSVESLAKRLLHEYDDSEKMYDMYSHDIEMTIKTVFNGDVKEYSLSEDKRIKNEINEARGIANELGILNEKIVSISISEYLDTLFDYVSSLTKVNEKHTKDKKKEETKQDKALKTLIDRKFIPEGSTLGTLTSFEHHLLDSQMLMDEGGNELETVYTKKGFAPSKMVINGSVKTNNDKSKKFKKIEKDDNDKNDKALKSLIDKGFVPEGSTLLSLTTLERQLLENLKIIEEEKHTSKKI